MKTKFIFHGGMLKYQSKFNDSFFKEFTKDLEDGDEVLFIGFARTDHDNRKRVYERDKSLILAQTEKNITVTNATHENFLEQLRRVKAVFVTGGQTEELIKDIQKYPIFKEFIKGKTLAGSSAGAALFSTCYLCNEGVRKGLGLVPVKLAFHYGNPEFGTVEERLHLLDECPDDLELLTVEECKWVVREIDL